MFQVSLKGFEKANFGIYHSEYFLSGWQAGFSTLIFFVWFFLQKRENKLPKPPKFAPPQKIQELRKPRSHTVAAIETGLTASLELLSTGEGRKDDDQSSFLTKSDRIPTRDTSSSFSKPKAANKGPLPKVPILPGQKGEL